MDSASRKRNVSDGDSGFESALSSRSSSISLEESHELGKLLEEQVPEVDFQKRTVLREKFADILSVEEDIIQDVTEPELFIIRDKLTGREILYKPPTKIKFSSSPPQIEETFSAEEYARSNPIPRSQLFNARLELELEKQVAALDLVEVNLRMDPAQVPPPSLGIRVIGVNMIHGVPDKLNIYVKRVLEGSVAGLDGRIRVNDHIVEVNGVSLVGVSQKLAAETLSSCAINPETGLVQFLVAREKPKEPLAVHDDEEEEKLQVPPATTLLLNQISHLSDDADCPRKSFLAAPAADGDTSPPTPAAPNRRRRERQQQLATGLVLVSAAALLVVQCLREEAAASS